MGYKDVRIYRHGIIGWAKSGLKLEHEAEYPQVDIPLVSSQALAAALTQFRIIDVRPETHFSKGHIPGADNIDLEDLYERYKELTDGDRIILVDHKGKLTLTAGRFLFSKGITTISRLDGGFNAWVKEGYRGTMTKSQ